MPRSRSMSIESSTWASISRLERPPQSWMMRSASVDLPWSIWAMIEKLRILFIKLRKTMKKGAPEWERLPSERLYNSFCTTRHSTGFQGLKPESPSDGQEDSGTGKLNCHQERTAARRRDQESNGKAAAPALPTFVPPAPAPARHSTPAKSRRHRHRSSRP